MSTVNARPQAKAVKLRLPARVESVALDGSRSVVGGGGGYVLRGGWRGRVSTEEHAWYHGTYANAV